MSRRTESATRGADTTGRADGRPNIVYLHSHDSGRELSPYGAPVSTPHLQALAESGTVFRQAFAAAPTCSPSRAALLTGQWPHQSGMLGLAHRGHQLRDPQRHLARVLADGGYTTILAGLQHLGTDEATVSAMGYQKVIGTPDTAESAAVRFIEAAPETPFFLDVGFFETHRYAMAFNPDGERADGRYYPAPPGLPDTPDSRADYADYASAAARLDAKVGRVVDALERTGQLGRTLVIVTTDHGIPFPGAKCNTNDRGLGVALIVAGLPQVSGGRVIDSLVTHLDLYPTICDLTGVEHPHWLEGRSLLPLLDGDVDSLHDEVYGEVTFHVAYDPLRSVRTSRFRYTRSFLEDRPVTENCDAGLTKNHMLHSCWPEVPTAQEELYDVILDPTESNSLVGDLAASSTLDHLRRRLEDWMIRTDDPLVHGRPAQPVP